MPQASRRRRRTTDWAAASIGIITVATIIAAATVAAIISVNRETGGFAGVPNQGDARMTGIAAGIAVVSLWFYLLVVLAGLGALFGKSSAERELLVKVAAVGLYAQVFAIVTFAVLVILEQLT